MRHFTDDQLEGIILNALTAGDLLAVDAGLRVMAVQNPTRADEIFQTLKVGVALARERAPVAPVCAGAGCPDRSCTNHPGERWCVPCQGWTTGQPCEEGSS